MNKLTPRGSLYNVLFKYTYKEWQTIKNKPNSLDGPRWIICTTHNTLSRALSGIDGIDMYINYDLLCSIIMYSCDSPSRTKLELIILWNETICYMGCISLVWLFLLVLFFSIFFSAFYFSSFHLLATPCYIDFVWFCMKAKVNAYRLCACRYNVQLCIRAGVKH